VHLDWTAQTSPGASTSAARPAEQERFRGMG
jgi:hypothetical protein